MTRNEIEAAAGSRAWVYLPDRLMDGGMLFSKGGAQLMVYDERPKGFSVCTILNHPRVGRSTLWRYRLTPVELCMVFADPRAHIGAKTEYANPGGREALYQAERSRKFAQARVEEAQRDFARPHAMTEFCWCLPEVSGLEVRHRTQ